MSANPAASSLPPSDGGGAQLSSMVAAILAVVAPEGADLQETKQVEDALRPFAARLFKAESESVRKTRCYLDSLYKIREEHAPTQQPAEQPEAGGNLATEILTELMARWAARKESCYQGNDPGSAIEIENILTEVEQELVPVMSATPRPESPDAQRGELEAMAQRLRCAQEALKDCAHAFALYAKEKPHAEVMSEADRSVRHELTAIRMRLDSYDEFRSALPAKGPGPRSEELQAIYIEAANIRAELDFFRQGSNITVLERIQDRLKKIACGELAPPPASHSKQREQQT